MQISRRGPFLLNQLKLRLSLTKRTKRMPMITCGINVTLILINGVSIATSRDKVTINAINKPIIAIIRASNRCFFILASPLRAATSYHAANAKIKPRTLRPSSKRQHPILLALNALFSTLYYFWDLFPQKL